MVKILQAIPDKLIPNKHIAFTLVKLCIKCSSIAIKQNDSWLLVMYQVIAWTDFDLMSIGFYEEISMEFNRKDNNFH